MKRKEHMNTQVSEHIHTIAVPIAPNWCTMPKLSNSAIAAPIIEFFNTTLSYFIGKRICITSICSNPIININVAIIWNGMNEPSKPSDKRQCNNTGPNAIAMQIVGKEKAIRLSIERSIFSQNSADNP